METFNHSMRNLFDQLGLPSEASAIEKFIKSNQLAANVRLEDAPCWSESQLHFFQEERGQDAVWVEQIDELDALLHKQSM